MAWGARQGWHRQGWVPIVVTQGTSSPLPFEVFPFVPLQLWAFPSPARPPPRSR